MENESFLVSLCDCWIPPYLKPALTLDFPVTLVTTFLISYFICLVHFESHFRSQLKESWLSAPSLTLALSFSVVLGPKNQITDSEADQYNKRCWIIVLSTFVSRKQIIPVTLMVIYILT